MKILYVTGCLGFIPSYFVKKALDKGWMVFGVDKLTYAANTKILKKNFKSMKTLDLSKLISKI